jgi:hypothetical protein
MPDVFDDLLNLSYDGVSSEFASLAEISQTLYAEDLELTFCCSSGNPPPIRSPFVTVNSVQSRQTTDFPLFERWLRHCLLIGGMAGVTTME